MNIPSDVILIIYKYIHTYYITRVNDEYHQLYRISDRDIIIDINNILRYNWRRLHCLNDFDITLNTYCYNVFDKNNIRTPYQLPKHYF